MDIVSIAVTLGIGLAAGWLASLVVGGGSLVKYIIWGVLGSIVAGLVLPAIGVSIDLGHALVTQIVTAAIGAVILVLAARLIG